MEECCGRHEEEDWGRWRWRTLHVPACLGFGGGEKLDAQIIPCVEDWKRELD